MQEQQSGGLGLLGLSHVSLSAVDLAVAEHFYIEVLGGQKVFDLASAEEGKKYGVFISMGNGTFVELFMKQVSGVREAAPMETAYRHICLQVRSIHDAATWLRQFGYEPQIKVGRVDRVPQFFIRGPDEVEIEFHEYCDNSLQKCFLDHDR
jgi:catechol 2,3-dioxygenase-like lactoylglutathione lyase family enzyme